MNPNFLIISGNEFKEIIHANRIEYCKGEGSYSEIILEDRKLTVSKNLHWIEQRLCTRIFFRSHKSFLINLMFIARVFNCEDKLTLENGTKIPLSRKNRKQFWIRFERFNNHFE